MSARCWRPAPWGIMQACLDVVLPYVRERRQFDKPIGTFQLMQGKIADMYVALNSARAYVYAVARACDAGRTTRVRRGRRDPSGQRERGEVRPGGPSRPWAAPATPRTIPWSGCCATPSCTISARGTNEIRRFLIGRELVGAG